MSADHQPAFWRLSKLDQKRQLEREMHMVLSMRRKDLSISEKYLLCETLCHTLSGRYELACASMDDLYESPDGLVPSDELSEAAGSMTERSLMRMLRYIEGSPVRNRPLFG